VLSFTNKSLWDTLSVTLFLICFYVIRHILNWGHHLINKTFRCIIFLVIASLYLFILKLFISKSLSLNTLTWALLCTAFWCSVLSTEKKYNKLHHREEMPARSVFERCQVSFLWLSLKVEELCGLIWDIWIQLTYYNLLPLLKENRDTWLYILLSIISSSSLRYFVLRIFFLFLKYIFILLLSVIFRRKVYYSWLLKVTSLHNKWSYNNKLFKVWSHLPELWETKSKFMTV